MPNPDDHFFACLAGHQWNSALARIMFRLLYESDAAVADRLIEAFDSVEAAVAERFVDKGPQMFCGLQFRALGGLEDKTDAIGHAHLRLDFGQARTTGAVR